MLQQFGLGDAGFGTFLILFLVFLGVGGLIAFLLRRFTGGRLAMPSNDRARSRQPRLGIVDIYDLDRQRQLILLRRDNVEHLLLIGGPNDLVVETNIVRVGQNRAPSPPSSEAIEPPPPQRPAVEPPTRPVLEGARPAPARIPEGGGPEELAPVGTIPPTPVAARPELPLRPDTVIAGAAVPAMPPTFERPRPPGRPEAGREARPDMRPPRPPRPEEPPRPQPEPAAQQPAISPVPDAAIFDDMARQLEQALRRPTPPTDVPAAPPAATRPPEPVRPRSPLPEPPASGPPPGPATRPPPAPRPEGADRDPPVRPTISPRPEAPPRPVAPPPLGGPASPPSGPVRPPAPGPSGPASRPAAASAPTPPTALQPQAPEPPRAEPAPSEPPPWPKPELAARAAPADSNAIDETAPALGKPTPDPFSVEEIEAEFARLLGRPTDKG